MLMSQCHVIKQIVNAMAYTIELWMHLVGLLSTRQARVARGDRLLRFFRSFVKYAFTNFNVHVNRFLCSYLEFRLAAGSRIPLK